MSTTYYLTRLTAKDISVILGKALQQHLNCFDQRNVHIQSGLGGLEERARPAATVVGRRNANNKSHVCKDCSENGLRGDGGGAWLRRTRRFLGSQGHEGHIRTCRRAEFSRPSKSQKAPGHVKDVQEGSRLLAGLLALHHRVIGRGRLHGPGWRGGREGQLGLGHPAD